MVRGAIQTIQEIKPPNVRKRISESLGWGQYNEAFVSPVFKVDAQGKITFWNRACEEDFGYPSSDMVGKSAFELVSKKHWPLFTQALRKAFQGEALKNTPWKYHDSQGNPVYVLAQMYTDGGKDEKGTECIVLNTNITELSLRMRRLELYAAEKKEKLKNLIGEYDLLKKT
jgi:PAS domain S-box-containing protein